MFNIVEKIHKIVEDMTIDIPEESLRSLNLCEENTEEGSYFELSDLCWQTRIPAICKNSHSARRRLPRPCPLVRLTAPAYGCQVTVQSEDEKQLRKQMRKEEKKINKLLRQVNTSVKEFKG